MYKFTDHNRIHAADVLQGCYYLTCHPVCALLGTSGDSPGSSLSVSDNSSLPLSSSMSTLEVRFIQFILISFIVVHLKLC